ncbi:MAG: beta-galactosidase, partial [Oscillospiraceae bacterium]
YFGKNETFKLPIPIPSRDFGTMQSDGYASLFSQLGNIACPHHSSSIMSMEKYGQNYGFILYRTTVAGPLINSEVLIKEIHDRAQIFINGKKQATVYRNDKEKMITADFPENENVLEILVENMGRTNYGCLLNDAKGITECVLVNYQMQYNWDVFTMEMDNPDNLIFSDNVVLNSENPSFYRIEFTIDEPADTYVFPKGFSKGIIWINGFNLGRFWNEKGPQLTLYLPAPLLKKGINEIIVFECDHASTGEIELIKEYINK